MLPCFKDLLYFPRTVQISWHHMCPYLSAAYLLQHSLHRECVNYHGRTVEVSFSFTRIAPQGFQTQTHTHTHTLSLDRSFRHLRLSLWQQTLYDGRVDTRGKARAFKNRIFAGGQLYRSDVRHRTASHVEAFGSLAVPGHHKSQHCQTRIFCVTHNTALSRIASNQSAASCFVTRVIPTSVLSCAC